MVLKYKILFFALILLVPSLAFANAPSKSEMDKYFSVKHTGSWSSWNKISPIWDNDQNFVEKNTSIKLVRGSSSWFGFRKTIYLYKDFGDYEFQKTIDISESLEANPDAWQEIRALYQQVANKIESSKSNYVQHDWELAVGAPDTINIQYNETTSSSSASATTSSAATSAAAIRTGTLSSAQPGAISVTAPTEVKRATAFSYSVTIDETKVPNITKLYTFFTRPQDFSTSDNYTKEKICEQAVNPANRVESTCIFCHFQPYTCLSGSCDKTFTTTGLTSLGQSRIVIFALQGNDYSKESCVNYGTYYNNTIVTVSENGPAAGSTSSSTTTGGTGNSNPDFGQPATPSQLSRAAGITVTSIDNLINKLTSYWLPTIAGAAAVICLIIGGIQMITAAGEEKQFTTGRQTVFYTIIGILIVLAAYIILIAVRNTIKSFFP